MLSIGVCAPGNPANRQAAQSLLILFIKESTTAGSEGILFASTANTLRLLRPASQLG